MSTSDTQIISLLLLKKNDVARSTLIQDIRVKFEKIARYKQVPFDDVDDVVNGGIEKLLKNLSKFHGLGSFNGWVSVLFGNHCMDYFRKVNLNKRFFVSGSLTVDENEEDRRNFDHFPSDVPDACESAKNKQQLERVLSVMDRVISETSALRRNSDRDAEIARLGLKGLLEPKEIMCALVDRFPGLSLNAIRIVLHTFRTALRGELDNE